MENEIKCGEGIFAFISKQPKNEFVFTGKPMTEREFKIASKKLVNQGVSKENLEFIRKILYSEEKLKNYEKR